MRKLIESTRVSLDERLKAKVILTYNPHHRA